MDSEDNTTDPGWTGDHGWSALSAALLVIASFVAVLCFVLWAFKTLFGDRP